MLAIQKNQTKTSKQQKTPNPPKNRGERIVSIIEVGSFDLKINICEFQDCSFFPVIYKTFISFYSHLLVVAVCFSKPSFTIIVWNYIYVR